MNETDRFDEPGVIAFIQLLQGLISRFGSNSVNCKYCAVAILAVVMGSSNSQSSERFLVGLIPIVLFLFIDAYYLGLERRCISIYNGFISRIKNNEETELFTIPKSTACEQICGMFKGLCSLSTLPFYGFLALTAILFSCLS